MAIDETEFTADAKVYVFNKPRRPSFFRRNQRSSVGPQTTHEEDSAMATDAEKPFCTQFKTSSTGLREFLAEFLGSFVLVLCGNAIGASILLGRFDGVAPLANAFGWGLSVAFGIYVSGGVSGAHLNPAVTVALATIGKFKWGKVLHYMAGQYLGAFVASAVLFGIYIDALTEYDGGYRATDPEGNSTAQIFSTFPKAHVSIITCFFDQILGTALLLLAISGISDERNMKIPKCLQPLAVGLSVCCVILAFSFNCGAALNPSRDLGPRIFTALAGWGAAPFSHRNYAWFWIPVISCHLGGIIGAWAYKMSVDLHWPNEEYQPHWKLGSVASVSNDMGVYPPAHLKHGISVQADDGHQDRR